MYQWVVFAHVLGIFGFLLAHGTAAAVGFKLRGEREIARVRALLDLSRAVTIISSVSLLVLLAAGITAGFMGNWWGQGWIWASLILFIIMGVAMTPLGSRPLNRIRALLQPNGQAQAKTATLTSADVSLDQQLAVLLAGTHPWLLTVIGGGGLTIILWLMMFKPF
jgi:hypothetical protein